MILPAVCFFYDRLGPVFHSIDALLQSLALWAAAFYIVNWTLATAFFPHPGNLADKIFYYGVRVFHAFNLEQWLIFLQVAPFFTFPLFFMVVYDFPRDRPWLYQIYLTFSTWVWSVYQILFM